MASSAGQPVGVVDDRRAPRGLVQACEVAAPDDVEARCFVVGYCQLVQFGEDLAPGGQAASDRRFIVGARREHEPGGAPQRSDGATGALGVSIDAERLSHAGLGQARLHQAFLLILASRPRAGLLRWTHTPTLTSLGRRGAAASVASASISSWVGEDVVFMSYGRQTVERFPRW